MLNKINQLFQKANQLNYDEDCGMVMVEKTKGPGFFPGCVGLYDIDRGNTEKLIMVVGQDFDTKENHKKLTEEGEVNSNPTWRNLKKLLDDIHIDKNDCFFTNAYMGLRKNALKNTGPSPAKKSQPFVKQCQEFFKEQLRAINPEIVLILGLEPAKFIAKMFPGGFTNWSRIRSLRKLYEDKGHICQDFEFEGRCIRFLFVIHPSLNNPNRAKIWKDSEHQEITILKEHLSNFTTRHNSYIKP